MQISNAKLSLAMLNAGIDTSKELATAAGVGVNTISRILNGSGATIATVRRLSVALNVEPADLVQEGGGTS